MLIIISYGKNHTANRTKIYNMHTDLKGWMKKLFDELEEDKFTAIMNAARGVHNGLLFTVTSRYPFGTNVFERDWDLLIILDACRVDAMREVATEFDFIESVDWIWSVGSSSHEWICKTFTTDYMSVINETVLLSTNPNVPRVLKDEKYLPETYSIPLMWNDLNIVTQNDFKLLRQIHRHDHEEFFTPPPPQLVTDHAIQIGRSSTFDRMIVHYFQPHRPYISGPCREGRPLTDVEADPWSAIKSGKEMKSEVWELYLDNLRLVLNSVGRLRNNFDADNVIISADHGELFGEWGAYGHPEGFLHPNLRRVPWVKTNATDKGTCKPNVDIGKQESDIEIEGQLRDLGYL